MLFIRFLWRNLRGFRKNPSTHFFDPLGEGFFFRDNVVLGVLVHCPASLEEASSFSALHLLEEVNH